jgi:DNA-binding XRE family transcriptional regulator
MPSTATSGQRTNRKRNLELISLRINAGLSRETLALRAQVGKETVRLAEAGFVPGPRIQFAIATVLGTKPLDLWPIDRQPAARPQRKVAA